MCHTSIMANPSHLSPEFILQLKAELEADIRLYKELPERIAHKTKKYEAALLFAPAGFDPNAPTPSKTETTAVVSAPKTHPSEFALVAPDVDVKQPRIHWGSALLNVLEASGRGMTHKELLAVVKATFPELHSSNGEKGFYNAIARLQNYKSIIKHGTLLFSSKVVKAMNERGEELPEPEPRPRPGGSGEIVLSILREHTQGLTGPQLKQMACAVPDAPRSLKDHGQYIYNILATLIGSGAVVKENGIYRLNDAES